MSSVKEWHDKAMELADSGFRERARGDAARSQEFFAQALEAELAAIGELDEPNGLLWSILHRSAGTLALDCRRFRQAEQIAATALAGEPQPEIAEELRDLLKQIYFQRHLDAQGLVLTDSELQLSLAGPEVGAGIAEQSLVSPRVDSTARLIYRSIERKYRLPFRDRGQPPKELRDRYKLLVSVPRSGSYALSFRFAETDFPSAFPYTATIIDEFMELVALVNRFHIDAIREIIPHPDYQRNFFSLAQKIAPDGAQVSQVGFTAQGNGRQRSVELTAAGAEIAAAATPKQKTFLERPDGTAEIRGLVSRFRSDGAIVISTPERRYTVMPSYEKTRAIGPELREQYVVAKVIRRGGYLSLDDIRLTESREWEW